MRFRGGCTLNVIAFILAVVAAVIFLFVPDGYVSPRLRGRSSVALGLFFLTVALIVQFCSTTRGITF